jgi:hypothetical protein
MPAPAAVLLVLLAQGPSPWAVSLDTEARVESLKFHFDNPSSFDTAELVPHFFEQTYDTDHVWTVVRVDHPLGRLRASFEGGVTPAATRGADDFDTFFQPDGNVIVSGTTGDASTQSWRLSERIEIRRGRLLRVGLAYSYRRDRARFHDGDGITTTTLPPSIAHRLVTTRETTVSQLHAITWFGEMVRQLGPRDSIETVVDASPAALARLTVDLPDKYPGQLLAFDARVAMISGRATYRHAWTHWSLSAGAGAGRTFSWRRDSRLDLRTLVATVGVTRRIP